MLECNILRMEMHYFLINLNHYIHIFITSICRALLPPTPAVLGVDALPGLLGHFSTNNLMPKG